MASPSRGLAWLDWLRFGAAFAVLIDHAKEFSFVPYGELPASQQDVATQLLFAATRLGQPAVILFFVLSGYLVGGRLVERVRAGQFELGSYAIERGTRVFVPLVPAVLLSIVLAGGNVLARHGDRQCPWAAGTVVPVLANNGSLWTLAYEIWFYIIAGGVAALLARRGKLPALLVIGVAAGFLAALQPHYLLCWALGAAAWLWKPSGVSAGLFPGAALLIAAGGLASELGTEGIMHARWFAGLPLPAANVVLASGFALLIRS